MSKLEELKYITLYFEDHKLYVKRYNELTDEGMFVFSLEGSNFVCVPCNFKTQAKLAGYDYEKIDTSVPQYFFNKHGIGYVWYYGNEWMFGEAVLVKAIRDKAAKKLRLLLFNALCSMSEL